MRGNVEMVRATIVRLAGRPIEVRVDVEAQSSPRPPTVQRGLVSPEIRDHPIVKLAADLFDAAIVDVTPLQRGDATPHDDAAVSDRLDSGFENTSGQ